jgi:hypothetical protein
MPSLPTPTGVGQIVQAKGDYLWVVKAKEARAL